MLLKTNSDVILKGKIRKYHTLKFVRIDIFCEINFLYMKVYEGNHNYSFVHHYMQRNKKKIFRFLNSQFQLFLFITLESAKVVSLITFTFSINSKDHIK